jgi:hypothetical protein
VRLAVAVLDVALQPDLEVVRVVGAHGDVAQRTEPAPPQLQAGAVGAVHRAESQELREDHLGDDGVRAVVDAGAQAHPPRLGVGSQVDLDAHRDVALGRGQGGVGQAEAVWRLGDLRGAVRTRFRVVGEVVRPGQGQAQQTGAGRAGDEVRRRVVQAQGSQGAAGVDAGAAVGDVEPAQGGGGLRGGLGRRRHAVTSHRFTS